jgi:hypothetical protein
MGFGLQAEAHADCLKGITHESMAGFCNGVFFVNGGFNNHSTADNLPAGHREKQSAIRRIQAGLGR